MEDLSTYDLDDLEAAVEEHGMTVVGRQRWDEVRTDSADLRVLRKGLQGEVERLKAGATALRKVATTPLGRSLDRAEVAEKEADRLSALLDSGGEK
jgi:hypothetical protein